MREYWLTAGDHLFDFSIVILNQAMGRVIHRILVRADHTIRYLCIVPQAGLELGPVLICTMFKSISAALHVTPLVASRVTKFVTI